LLSSSRDTRFAGGRQSSTPKLEHGDRYRCRAVVVS
jgi:hypothetical protein